MKDRLSEFFKIFPWPSDPETLEGREYFSSTIKNMEKLFGHVWFKDILKKKKVKILEICGGAGFGGVALSKLFLEKKLEVDLIITDLRKEALKKAKKLGERLLKRKILTKVMDAMKIDKIKKKFDIVLMYGFSAPQFNPWEIVRLFSSVGDCLENKGIFIIDEVDRRYHIFLLTGYKWALGEGDEEKFVMSFHTGYNILKGTFTRTFFNPVFSKKPLKMELFYWGLAELGALTLLFFEDVDFVPVGGTRHFILGYRPRGVLLPASLKEPYVFSKNKCATE